MGSETNACNLWDSIGNDPSSAICHNLEVFPATAKPILFPLITPREVFKLFIKPFSLTTPVTSQFE